ncbi:MAG: hypothetical protein J6I76_21595, partial [Oribacterium sp.]|nr:hypothetical protein [Oribacterium sp.]
IADGTGVRVRSIHSSEVLGLRSTLTSCLGDNAPKGVIVGQGETCSTFICGFTYPALNDPKVKPFIKMETMA